MDYLLLTVDTILLFLSPFKELHFEQDFVTGVAIVILISFLFIIYKPVLSIATEHITDNENLVKSIFGFVALLIVSNFAMSSRPISDNSLFIIVPAIVVRILDGLGASKGVFSLIASDDESKILLPTGLTVFYGIVVYELGGFDNLTLFTLLLGCIHLSMLFITLIGTRIIAYFLSETIGNDSFFLPIYFYLSASIFLTNFLNFNEFKTLGLTENILYYIYLAAYLVGIFSAIILKKSETNKLLNNSFR